MGAINFGTLTSKSSLALVNIIEVDEEDEKSYENIYEWDYEEIKTELEKKYFYYFNLSIDFGYYEGFYIILTEERTKYIYQNSKEKAEAIKELTQIKKILIDFIKNNYLKGCYPSWCTTYISKTETIKELNAIIKEYEEREKAKKLKA